MIYYIPDFYVTGIGYNALNKSREDLVYIYKKLGFKMLGNPNVILKDEKVMNYQYNMEIIGEYVSELLNEIDAKVKSGDYIFMDFPFSVKFQSYSKIVSYAVSKKIHIIFFVHDLDGIRFRNPFMNFSDSSVLDMASCLITASSEMDQVLFEKLKVSKSVKTINHVFWDYIVDDVCVNTQEEGLICFAGNLAKSSFISKIPNSLIELGFNCYGKGYPDECKAKFCGEYKPSELVSKISGKFGLVWDGKSEKSCSGNFGKYLRINTSHKFGLYMAANKPVIVWKDGSLARFVIEHNIGFAVSSLEEIPFYVSKIDHNAYIKMKENVSAIRKEVINGDHLSKVILESLNQSC